MPMLIPDQHDLDRMNPQQRAKVRRYIAKVCLELDQYAHLTVTAKAAQRQRDLITWAENVREQARRLEADYPTEPPEVTHARRQALLDAIR
jgi:hypothetical protein